MDGGCGMVLVSGMVVRQNALRQLRMRRRSPLRLPIRRKPLPTKWRPIRRLPIKAQMPSRPAKRAPIMSSVPRTSWHVQVWKENDLTATLPVRPDGKISLPLLNDVQAAGLTPEQLAQSLTEKLKKYIADPRVTVVVTAINSKRIYLIGEVLHTGGMPLLPNMTVLQALSSAGLNQFAKTKGIYVLAHSERQTGETGGELPQAGQGPGD